MRDPCIKIETYWNVNVHFMQFLFALTQLK